MHPLIPLSAVAAAFLLLRRDPSSDCPAPAECPPGEPAVGYAYVPPNGPAPVAGVLLKDVSVYSFAGKNMGGSPLTPMGVPVPSEMPDGRMGRVMLAQAPGLAGGVPRTVLLYFV